MSISDKLIQVAENTPKVYEAGYQAGKATGDDRYEQGFTDGQVDGYETGLQDGFVNGKDEAYRIIWDDIQNKGSRINYQNAFYEMGTDAFRPLYDITIKQCTSMFQYSSIPGSLTDILAERGIKMVWRSDATGNTSFYGSKFTQIPPIIAPTTLNYFFCGCTELETIDGIDMSRIPATSTSAFSNTYYNCTSLKNLIIIGDIKPSGMDVSVCPLTHDSLMSIINALEKKTSGTFTVTLGSSNLAKLTDAEKAIATQKGWTLA